MFGWHIITSWFMKYSPRCDHLLSRLTWSLFSESLAMSSHENQSLLSPRISCLTIFFFSICTVGDRVMHLTNPVEWMASKMLMLLLRKRERELGAGKPSNRNGFIGLSEAHQASICDAFSCQKPNDEASSQSNFGKWQKKTLLLCQSHTPYGNGKWHKNVQYWPT